MKKIAVALLVLVSGQMRAGEQLLNQCHSILVPGQNGCGGDSFLDNNVVNTGSFINFGTESDPSKIDFGQRNCVARFQEQYAQLNKATQAKQNIFYGVSQGTATLINWLTHKHDDAGKVVLRPHAEQEKIAQAVVLEAVLGSGNNAIMHYATQAMPAVSYLPLSRAWSPWVAKAIKYPSYKPYGQQMLSSIQHLSPNISAIMKYDRNDPETSPDDARQAYINARKAKHNRVYLMETGDGQQRHIDLLGCWGRAKQFEKIAALQAIYQKEGLPFANKTAVDYS